MLWSRTYTSANRQHMLCAPLRQGQSIRLYPLTERPVQAGIWPFWWTSRVDSYDNALAEIINVLYKA